MPALALVLAALAAPTPVTAYGGRLVWSERDASGNYSLVTRVGSATTPVAVPPRRVPFDADLGPTADGHVAAVYSRCVKDPPPPSGYGSVAAYEHGRGCDLYEFDFATGSETRLSEASSPTASEAWPSLWRGRLAFERAYDGRHDRPYLYFHVLGSGHRSDRLAPGPRRGCRAGRCGVFGLSRATGIDLRGATLAFSWTMGGVEEGLATQVRIDRLGGAPRVLDAELGGGLTHIVVGAPSIGGGRVYWSRGCFGDASGCARRYGLRRERLQGGPIENAPGPRSPVAHARIGARTYVLRDTSATGSCNELETGRPTCRLLGLSPRYR